MTNVKDPSDHMIASNDMYPLFDADGKVSGVAEISRSRNTRIKQVRGYAGADCRLYLRRHHGRQQADGGREEPLHVLCRQSLQRFDLRGERRRQGVVCPVHSQLQRAQEQALCRHQLRQHFTGADRQ